MKRISTIRHFKILLLVGLVGAYSAAKCAPVITSTICNAQVTNNGTQYSFDVYVNASEPCPVSGALLQFYYNVNALQPLALPTGLTLVDNFKAVFGASSYVHDSQVLAIQLYGDNHPSITLTTQSVKVLTMTFTVTNPILTSQLNWCLNYYSLPTMWTNTSSSTFSFEGNDNSPLPIQLASFQAATFTGNGVTLTWTTASETNNYGFNVQRNGANIAFIQGHGTTIGQHTYSHTDNPGPGKYQYRLQQVDLNGTATLSGTILIDVAAPVPATFVLNQNYPNPFNPSTQVAFSISKEGPVSLRVYDILGREVATLVNENRKPGQYTERFDGGRVASGVYMFVLKSSEGQLTSRMILSK